jgi:hypothetical protein
VETFFSVLTRQRIRRGSFHSIVSLQAAINQYLDQRNAEPRPFVWTASAASLVGGIVVDDGLDDPAGWHGPLDGIEEADELLVPVALHAAADHGAFQHVQCREQRRRAMALVVMRLGTVSATL